MKLYDDMKSAENALRKYFNYYGYEYILRVKNCFWSIVDDKIFFSDKREDVENNDLRYSGTVVGGKLYKGDEFTLIEVRRYACGTTAFIFDNSKEIK